MQTESLSKYDQVCFCFSKTALYTLTTCKKYLTYAPLNDIKAWNHVLESLVLIKNDNKTIFLLWYKQT